MTDETKEKIKLETELLRYLLILGLALGSGTLTVILSAPTGIRLILAIAGAIVTFLTAYWSWRQYLKINALIVGGTL